MMNQLRVSGCFWDFGLTWIHYTFFECHQLWKSWNADGLVAAAEFRSFGCQVVIFPRLEPWQVQGRCAREAQMAQGANVEVWKAEICWGISGI
jgi:hypothetical protein